MKLPENQKFRWNYTALAFALPMTMMLVLQFVTSALPFGEYSLYYYSDEFHQYFPFFKAFRLALRSGQSILWSWDVGLGMDYLGLISYYLASPLNLLSVLIPDGWVEEYFALLMPIKLSLASMFFAIMLKKLFQKDDLSIVLFGAFYGMCAWAMGYQWNIMWLDTFAILPLVMLGMVQLLRDKKFVLYTISLFLAVFSNYYVGFFVCIFVFLTFFCYEICRFKSIWRFCTDLFRIGVFSVLAIGMTAILELPTLASLQDTYSSINSFPEGFSVNIISGDAVDAAKIAWDTFKTAKEAGEATFSLWWSAMWASFPPLLEGMVDIAGQMGGGQTLTYVDGLPNIYCGVFPVAMAILFLLSGDVRLRDKLCSVFLLLLFMLSFLLRQLDYIWHGFHFTNQIPYRFSFLFCFVLLYMAYQAWALRDRFQIWQIVAAGLFSASLLLIKPENQVNSSYVLYNMVFLGLYLILMLFGHKDLRFTAKPEQVASETEREPELPPLDPDDLTQLVTVEEQQLPEFTEDAILEEEPIEFAEEIEETQVCFEEEMVPEQDILPPPETRHRIAALGIACLMLLELIVGLINFAAGYSIATYDYPKNNTAVQKALATIRDLENGNSLFYRTEVTHTQTLNDGALNGYYGISTFTSSANVKTTEFMEALGYAGRNNWNRYCFEEASPVANLFLNLKYMIERDNYAAPNDYFTNYPVDDVILMRNNYALPLGFLTEAGITNVNFSESNPITLQNKLFKAATGLTENVWQYLPTEDLTVTTSQSGDITLGSINISGYTSFKTQEKGGTLTYTYDVSQEGFLCLDLTLYAQKNFSVRLNGKLLYSEGYSLPCTMAVASVKPGDVVRVDITCKANTSSAVHVRAAMLNHEVFTQGYDILSASTLQLTDFSTNYISGMIRCNRDGVLYTSIPQCGNKRTEEEEAEDGSTIEATTAPEGNWVAYVDGVRADIVLVGDAMIALELTEGVHTVEFRYENKSFTYGSWITLGSLALFGGIIAARYVWKRKRENAQ